MSENESHHHGKNEIIIIKRHGHGDHGHHGGAWKIAYADFMTAMMAFFLVMWLVNAANDATKAAVASYFNPIKLTDSSPADKGITKPGKQAQGEATQEKSKVDGEEKSQGDAAASGQEKSSTAGEKTSYSEADYFENPYAVLSEIVLEVGDQANVSVKGEGGAASAGPATGADGGEAYKDPFDPDFWTKQVQVNSKTSKGQDAGKAGKDQAAAAVAAQDRGNENGLGGIPGEADTKDKGKGGIPGDQASAEQGKGAPAAEQGGAVAAKPVTGEQQDKAQEVASAQSPADKAAAKAAADLKKQIISTLPASVGKLADAIKVEPSEGGLLISVSDQVSTPMFDVGSAVPSRELVLAMQDIGKVLSKSKGSVVIRGHTDGRPYKGGTGDNWGLSLNRARSAYYMLVSGGLEEKRINQVTGYADRFLKVPSDPYSPANRRIEILLEGKTVAGG
ncbi:MAG TPA: MotB family protein [Ensifer sp.]|nr:MotB family protein [Ensifer sp.]